MMSAHAVEESLLLFHFLCNSRHKKFLTIFLALHHARVTLASAVQKGGPQLATLNVNIPRFYCLLRKEFLYDGLSHHNEFLNVCVFAAASIHPDLLRRWPTRQFYLRVGKALRRFTILTLSLSWVRLAGTPRIALIRGAFNFSAQLQNHIKSVNTRPTP
jgi:hypothetical protein